MSSDRRDRQKQYYAANRERILERNRAYWHANKDWLERKRKPRKRKWKKLSPEKAREVNLISKVARNLGITHTEARRQLGLAKVQRPSGPT
jgi:hypothetical protein